MPSEEVLRSSATKPGLPTLVPSRTVAVCAMARQCHRNAGAKALCFSLHFLNLSLTVHCGDRSLNYLIAQPQVYLGGNSVMSGCPSLVGVSWTTVYVLPLWVSHTVTWLWQTCTHTYMHKCTQTWYLICLSLTLKVIKDLVSPVETVASRVVGATGSSSKGLDSLGKPT